MSCRRIRRLLACRRELTDREERATAQHLAVCTVCRAVTLEYELMDRRFDRLPEPVSPLTMPAAVRRSFTLALSRPEAGEPARASRPASQAMLMLALLAVAIVAVSIWSPRPTAPTARPVSEGLIGTEATDTTSEAGRRYVVRDGDTLLSLSQRFDVPVELLRAVNPSIKVRFLNSGEVIWIPVRAADSSFVPPSRGEAITYTVQVGDSVWSVAHAFGLEPESVLWSNPQLGGSPELIVVGDLLVIPPMEGIWYTVQEGDTVESLAKTYQTTLEKIVSYEPNFLKEPHSLTPGQQIMIPDAHKSTTPRRADYPLAQGHPPDGVPRGDGIFAWPVEGSLAQPYWSSHPAIDIANRTGTPIYAADDGYVTLSGRDTWGYGNQVVIDHGNSYQTRYARLNTVLVRAGESVGQGQQIGTMGSTGRATAPHLHFEILQDATPIDPLGLLP